MVDLVADWCGPCRKMNEETWPDTAVQAWLSRNAIAIQVKPRTPSAARPELQGDGYPTIFVFRDGKEFDRDVGGKTSEDLLRWFSALDRGQNGLQLVQSDVAEDPEDVHARLELALKLMRAKRYAEATDAYLWFWQNAQTYEPYIGWLRNGEVARQMGQLASVWPDARARIVALRDAAAPDRHKKLRQHRLEDWIHLNAALGEEERTLAWYERWLEARTTEHFIEDTITREIFPLLEERDRWADMGRLYANPQERFEHEISYRKVDQDDVQRDLERLRETAKQMVRSLRAAGRTAEAESVTQKALEADPSDEMKAAVSGEE